MSDPIITTPYLHPMTSIKPVTTVKWWTENKKTDIPALRHSAGIILHTHPCQEFPSQSTPLCWARSWPTIHLHHPCSPCPPTSHPACQPAIHHLCPVIIWEQTFIRQTFILLYVCMLSHALSSGICGLVHSSIGLIQMLYHFTAH